MHDGYSLNQYIDVVLYMVGMIVLFAGIFISIMWFNDNLFNKNKNKIYTSRKRNNKEKKWFYDVA